MNKPLRVELHIMSPVHIGCDDVYEPTNFVIDEHKKKLITFYAEDFIRGISDDQRKEFSKICMGENLLSLYKFVKSAYNKSLQGREVDITSGIADHYKKIIQMSSYDKNAVINKFIIQRTAFNPQSNAPYIPGSSLKGSVRTAYLNAVAKVKNVQSWQGKAIDLERILLQGSFETDPFRMVKFSDLSPKSSVTTKIMYAVNRKKRESERATLAERGPTQIFEVICDGIFEGSLNIDTPMRDAGIALPITADNLKRSINKFFIPLMESEITMLKQLDINVPLINKINKKFGGKINKSAFILRIGRHSGAEAVTIEGNRSIKIMQGRGKAPNYLDHATTIWLASEKSNPEDNNGLLPFGWAVMEVMAEN